MEDWVMGAEALQIVGLSRERLRQLSEDGTLGRRVSKNWIYTRAELEAYKAKPKDKGGRPSKGTRPRKLAPVEIDGQMYRLVPMRPKGTDHPA